MKIVFTLLFTCAFSAAEASYPLHSHNDYHRKLPLLDAINNNFESVEVDIWNHGKGIKIAHNPWQNDGKIEELYLNPIKEMIKNGEFPYTQENPFILWIDIKAVFPSIVSKLARLIEQYPMIGKEVKVILTGRSKLKQKFIKDYPELPAETDSNVYPAKTSAPTWYTLKWSKFTDWNGQGELPKADYQKIKELVDAIHLEGRKLRFYATPDTEAYWALMQELKVDLTNSDETKTLKDFWESIFPPRK